MAVALLTWPVHARKALALPDILQAAADYLVQYSQRLSAIAAEEESTQQDTSPGPLRSIRRLNSDFVLVGLGDGVVEGFRDVYGKDGNALRDRQNRLLDLFRTSPASSLAPARQISDDCVRYSSPRTCACWMSPPWHSS
jgi:hypothetical protein